MARLLIVTDLDGTLLDEKTYSYRASLTTVETVKSLGIPLILCSSKTQGEVLSLWKELALVDPFIVENGGAIYVPGRYFPFSLAGFKSRRPFEVLELGTDVRTLRQILAETAALCRVAVKSFGSMSLEEISAITGLTKEQSALALKRKYDEPFLVERGDRERLFRTLIGRGFTVTRGDRFFHLIGNHSKGKGLKILFDLYRRSQRGIFSVGLGNSANDLPLFSQVDLPVLIKKSDGSHDPEVLREMADIERTQGIGPAGWREAVEKILATVP